MLRKILWFGIAVILISTPIARGAVRIWAWGPVLLVEYGLILVWLWKMNHKKRAVPSTHRQSYISGTVPFVILAVVSFGFASYKHESFFALLKLFGYIGTYYVIVSNFGHRMVKRLMYLVICIGTGLSAYGLLQYFGFLSHAWWVPKEFLSATYVNHNHFAGYLEMAIPVALAMLVRKKSPLLLAALAVMASAFVFTQSRGAWICLTASLFIMGIALIKNKVINAKSIFVLLWLVMVVVLIAYANKSAVSKRMDSVAVVMTEGRELRPQIWQGAFKMIIANPVIGTGIGTFDRAFNRYRPIRLNSIRAEFAHNDYINMAAEMGMAAPLIMLWIFFAVVRRGFAKGQHPLTFGCAAGVLSLALHGFVDFNFHIPANMLLFVVLIAVVMVEYKRIGTEDA